MTARKSPQSSILIFLLVMFFVFSLPKSWAQGTVGKITKIEGTIAKIDATTLTIKGDDAELTLSIDEKTEVKLAGKPATIADLKEGQEVVVFTDGAKAMSVEIAAQST